MGEDGRGWWGGSIIIGISHQPGYCDEAMRVVVGSTDIEALDT